MSVRGGARPGSGRPQAFDALERAAIGATCFRRLSEERERLRWERHERRPGIDDLRTAQAAVVGALTGPDKRLTALRKNVDVEVHAIRKAPAFVESPSRLFDVPMVRIKGIKPAVVAEVAAAFSREFGRLVTERTVKRCLAEHSSRLKREASEL